MPWCPVCRTEYDEGVTKCSDCDSALLDHLEPALVRKSVVIHHAESVDEVRVIVATLEAEGIAAFTATPDIVIRQESIVVNDDMNELDIMVLEDKAEEAKAILNPNQITDEELTLAEESDANQSEKESELSDATTEVTP